MNFTAEKRKFKEALNNCMIHWKISQKC